MDFEHEVTPDSFYRYDYLHYANVIYAEIEDMKSYQYSDKDGYLLDRNGNRLYQTYN